MSDSGEKWAQLAAPFPVEDVHWRVGATKGDRGMALCYVDARDVMERADEVLGPQNWQSKLIRADGVYVCHVGVRTEPGGEWIWRSDAAGETKTEGAKGGASDAFKRAWVQHGVGRYLYGLDSPWVDLKGKAIAESSLKKLDEHYVKATGGASRSGSAKGKSSRRAPGAAPAGSSGKIDADQRKHAMRANFQALELFYEKAFIDALPNDEKFAPVNYATAQLDQRRLEDVPAARFDELMEHMRRWVQDKRAELAGEHRDPAADEEM